MNYLPTGEGLKLTDAQHGSDTGIYDAEGRFRPRVFEDMFAAYDGAGDGRMTYEEMHRMRVGNREAWDVFGVSLSVFYSQTPLSLTAALHG